MKRIILLMAPLLSFVFFANAQSMDGVLEKIRAQYGEQSQEYLTALDNAISVASRSNDLELALTYRTRHLEIVRKMKSDNSIEYADDLWRIGNIANMKGDSIKAIEYYLAAADCFDKNIISNYSDKFYSNYRHCMYSICQHYYKINDKEKTELYTFRFAETSAAINELNSCDLLGALFFAGIFFERTGNNDVSSQYYKRIIDEYDVIDSCDYQYVGVAYSFLEDYYNRTMQYNLLIETATQKLQILKATNKEGTKDYYLTITDLFICAVEKIGDYALALDLSDEVESLIKKYSDNVPVEIYFFYKDMSEVCYQFGVYDRGLIYCDKALEILPSNVLDGFLGENSNLTEKISLLTMKSVIYRHNGKDNDARNCLIAAKETLDEIHNAQDTRGFIVTILEEEGALSSDFEEAITAIDSALLLNKQLVEETKDRVQNIDSEESISDSLRVTKKLWRQLSHYNDVRISLLINKADILRKYSYISKGYETLIEAKNLIETYQNTNCIRYLMCLSNIAIYQTILELYSDAINTLDKCMQVAKTNYGANHPFYPSYLKNYADYYDAIGNYTKAMDYSMEYCFATKRIFGEDSEQFAKSLKQLGDLYYSLDDEIEACRYYEEALLIFERKNISPDFLCPLYMNYSIALIELGKKEEGLNYANKAIQMTKAKYGENSYEYAYDELRICWAIKDYEKAFDFAGVAIETENIKAGPSFISLLGWYGKIGIEFLEVPLIPNYLQISTQTIRDYCSNQLVFYPSVDKNIAWKDLINVKNVLFSSRIDELSDSCLYNHVMFSKSFLLKSDDEYRGAIQNIERQDLMEMFNDIQAIQKTIDNLYFGFSPEAQSPQILYERKESLEKNLISKMKALGYSVNDSVSYYDVARALQSNEIAIEFVDYYHIKDKKTYYVALLAKSSWDKPVYVQLCTEDELKACLGSPNITYSADDLYRLLWQPLLEYVSDSSTVYFSPSGMLHTIALESLHTPDGSCLSDKYNLVRLTSTRELCKEKRAKTYETGAIYGGLQYDVEQQRMAKVAEMTKVKVEDSPVLAQKVRGGDRGNWKDLPGTLDEVEHIIGIMRKANIECKPYEGDLGSEESFKALSGSNTDIIHLATHGFFIEGEKADMNDFINSLSPLARQKTDSIIDPLLRSGLILSGGNNAWLGREVPEGIEDGVLTALEISTMNLSGTDMVVMSACETGLGDITSDGVFGLQRAFKMAGVQTLVMSLWKVDDNATSLMMQTFYEQLFSGKTKREAFNLAQAAVRNKYPEPYYWAGFVMLD